MVLSKLTMKLTDKKYRHKIQELVAVFTKRADIYILEAFIMTVLIWGS